MKALAAAVEALARVFLAVVFPTRFTGLEHVPEEGAFILCANHVSALDPVVILLRLRRNIHFMAKKELFENKFVASALRSKGAFPVDRGHADLGAIRESLRVLREGEGLGIFPQGTRSEENEHMEMHSGAAMIAQRSGAPVIPVYIDGPYRKFRKTAVRVGQPVELGVFGGKRDSETIRKVTREIDRSIWSMK